MTGLGLGSTPDDKYGTKENPNSTLKFEPEQGSQFKLLAPSIKYIEVDEKLGTDDTPVLSIYGTFGKTPGEVELIKDGGSKITLELVSWTKDKITCKLEPEEAGDIAVRANGCRSPAAAHQMGGRRDLYGRSPCSESERNH